MKNFWLIRHGLTAGNLERRYIGRTNEPLCLAGVIAVRALLLEGLPDFDAVYCSPYLRCVQTANILFPASTPIYTNDLRECDFGLFESKTADELSDDPAYAKWLDSGCIAKIPGGEDVIAFKERCCDAFLQIAEATREGPPTAVITHGGCIMAILERLARPKREFYKYHIPNCGYVDCSFDGTVLTVTGGSLC